MAVDLRFITETLERLGVVCRELPCKTGTLYYCKNPVNGITFDLKIEEDGNFRIWRFIGKASASDAGRQFESRSSSYPHTVVGIEITDEADISLYAEQKMNGSESEPEITRLIVAYLRLIYDPAFTSGKKLVP